MQRSEPMRKRMRALDGSSFRFERKDHTVLVNDLSAQVHVTKDGIIELRTEHKTVQVDGATYWEMIYDHRLPTPLSAGLLLAKYDALVGRLQQLAQRGAIQPSQAGTNENLW